jgi:hypothetical protein
LASRTSMIFFEVMAGLNSAPVVLVREVEAIRVSPFR